MNKISQPNKISPFTLDDYRKTINRLHNQAQYGCGNHGCRINPPKGMATNGGCRCSPYQIARELEQLAKIIKNINSDWVVNDTN